MNFYTPKNRWATFTDAELKILSDTLYWMPNSGERNFMYQQIAEEIARRRQGIGIGGGTNYSNNQPSRNTQGG